MFRRDSSDRAKAVESHRSIVSLAANADRGKQVFEKNCAKCHTPQRRRDRLGPDLSGVSDSEEGDVTILRRNIAEMRASAVSLMPDELEKQMTRQEVADVIAYLRAGL